ncbi:hypothetical protein C8R46DRAFT_1224002 [Mycena filopes]|nr:hypothetical protein C8R46DRAFT_1224002 [Mycena filopes]
MHGGQYELWATLEGISQSMPLEDRLTPERLAQGVFAHARITNCDSTGSKSILPGIMPARYSLTPENVIRTARSCKEDMFTHSFLRCLVEMLTNEGRLNEDEREQNERRVKLIEVRHFSQPVFFARSSGHFTYVPRCSFHILQLQPRLGKIFGALSRPYTAEEEGEIKSALIRVLRVCEEIEEQEKWPRATGNVAESTPVLEELAEDMFGIIRKYATDAVKFINYLDDDLVPLAREQYRLYPLPPFALHHEMIARGNRQMTAPWQELNISQAARDRWVE